LVALGLARFDRGSRTVNRLAPPEARRYSLTAATASRGIIVYERAISVVLPFRDAAGTLDAALAGLLADDQALEVLCIDDGSVDASAHCVRTWATRDPRVRLLTGGPGRGLVAALAQGIDNARGGLLARMDADDLSLPGRLAAQRTFLEQNAGVALVGTQVEPFDDEAPIGGGMLHYGAWQNALLTSEDHQRELFVESPVCHPSVMMRRDTLEEVGGYRAFHGPEDYELFLRLDARGHLMAKLPSVYLRWRHRPGRATFRDPRYALERLREVKTPFLTARVRACHKPRRVMWGAGPTGKRLARALEAHDLRFQLFIDVDPDKIGRTARGVTVASMEALNAETDVVVAAVGARGARELIRPALTERGFREGYDFWFAA
jgi:GT2 family glycosyltransferase